MFFVEKRWFYKVLTKDLITWRQPEAGVAVTSRNIWGRGKGFIVNKPSDVVGVLAQWLNHNMPRSAAQRKMQMGVSGRALGIGVALERPVGPDRRNDVWAVAGTGKSSLTRSL